MQDSESDGGENVAKYDLIGDKNVITATDIWIIHFYWYGKNNTGQVVINIFEVR